MNTLQSVAEKTHNSFENQVYLQTAGLIPEVQNGMINYCHQKLDNPDDAIHRDDIRKIAFYKTIEYGFLDLFLYEVDSQKFLFNEGYFNKEVHPLIRNYLHRLSKENNIETHPVYIGERLYDFELRLITSQSKKYIFGAIYQEAQNHHESINYLEKLFSRYYFRNEDYASILCEYNSLPELNALIRINAERAQKHAQKFHYILVEIEPLKKYIKVAGDYLVNEIIKNVQEMISVIIRDFGQCYILNSRQYLITASNVDDHLIKEKFGHAHFRVKNLLLIYHMNYYEVTDFEKGYAIEDIWPHLKIK